MIISSFDKILNYYDVIVIASFQVLVLFKVLVKA